ncbi:MAG TPA: hypothetical protein VGL72_30225 [Bryobacteraceae bacterium]|jgi:uncharacterized protein (TIGR02646 family)
MISRRWEDPNYSFIAKDKKGVIYNEFCRAGSPKELEDRLKIKGLEIQEIKPYDFGEWKKKAADATQKAIWTRVKDRWSHFQSQAKARWTWLTDRDITDIAGQKKALIAKIQAQTRCTADEAKDQVEAWSLDLVEETAPPGQTVPKTPINFNDDIWRPLKWHLFELFHGKCAYCECKPRAGQRGDVEHFRPKGKVTEDPDHPGYYWLAYDYRNYLPSCSSCNQPARAKLTHFPVTGPHAHEPRSLPAESPLLLNPLDPATDPFQHLEFDEMGAPRPHLGSPKGENSRTIFDLDRPDLTEARFEAIQKLEGDWNGRISQNTSISTAYLELQKEIRSGDREYSAAQLWALDYLRKKEIDKLLNLPPVVPAAVS